MIRRLPYVIATLALLLTEIFIALYVRDAWIRPFGGDLLVVILIYCAVRSVWQGPVLPTALGVLAFTYVIEILQGAHLVERLGLQDNRLAVIVIGNSFHWLDLLAYTAGIGLVVLFEWTRGRRTGHR